MPAPNTADRVVVSVQATESGDWQVVSTPTGFQGITTAAGFADNDYLHGFVRFENGTDWEVYDTDDGTSTNLLQISNITGTVTISRPATPYASSNSGDRVNAGSGTHTLTISLGSGTMKRIIREINGEWKTLTSGDATPDVSGYRLFKTAGTTAITAFDGMEDGKLFIVRRGASDISINDGAGISLPGDNNITLTTSNPAAIFVEDNGVAYLVGTVGTDVLDEDDFASDSASKPPSQQSTKAFTQRAPNLAASTELTIASGAITPTLAAHTVDTEGDAAADDLATITATNFSAGALLRLSLANAARVVTVTTGGNINLPGDKEIILDDTERTLSFRYNGSTWDYESGQIVWEVDAANGAGAERYGIVGDPAIDDDFGAEFRVNRRYSRPKVDISSIVCADPGDTPELAFVIANGEPGAATVRDGAYPGAYIYSIPYDGENIFLSYPHSGRNAQISFPLTETDVTEYKRGGGICFATTREGTKTPIDRFWVAPDGGTWIGYRGTCEDNPAYDSVFRVTDGAITSGAATLTSATGGFTAADASNSRVIRVEGAGASGADLVTTVSAYTDTNTVTLAANAGTTVTGATVYMGVDAYSYSSPEDASAPSGYHNWNDDKVSYGALNIVCPDLNNGSGLTFLKSGEVGGNRGDTRFDIKMSHASGELKFYRVASGSEHQLMAFRNSIDQVDFTGTLLVEGQDNANPQIFLRNTSESANEGHYWSLQNDNNGQLSIGSGSSSGGIETRMTLDKVATLTVESNDEGTTGAQLNLYHNSPSPAVSDFPGIINFQGEDSASNKVTYGSIASVTTNVTDGGTEAAELRFYTRQADNNQQRAWFGAGFIVGSPTGGDKGAGTINAVGVYDDNTLLTDLVLDMAVDGSFDAAKYAGHPVQSSLSQDWFNPDKYASFWKSERRLPGMLTWESPVDKPAVGELVTRLTAVVETQAVLIENLNQRIKALEAGE